MKTAPLITLALFAFASDLYALPAQDAKRAVLEEVVVEGRRQDLIGKVRSASEGVIGQEQLELRAIGRPGDVMEAIPSSIMTQHSSWQSQPDVSARFQSGPRHRLFYLY